MGHFGRSEAGSRYRVKHTVPKVNSCFKDLATAPLYLQLKSLYGLTAGMTKAQIMITIGMTEILHIIRNSLYKSPCHPTFVAFFLTNMLITLIEQHAPIIIGINLSNLKAICSTRMLITKLLFLIFFLMS